MLKYNLGKLKILVIEQNSLTSDALQLLLERLGIKDAEFSQTIDDAFDLFQHRTYDLVICDWSPGIDGIRFLNMIRHDINARNPYIPIIILSAFSRSDHIKNALNAGISEFIPKPFTARQIYACLLNVIEIPNFFVRSGGYFGPCRRHLNIAPYRFQNHKTAGYKGDERRIHQINMDDASWSYRT